MYNIAIVGAGQLGSRHLQGLAKIDIPINIQVVDTNIQSLDLAKVRYQQVPSNPNVKSISFHQRIDGLNDVLDLIIIATNANIRFKLIKEIISIKEIKHIILEKVVFQRPEEFEQIIDITQEKGIKCWVNCPRRMFPFYKKLKSEISNNEPISISLQGGNWGLACNAIHYFDLLSYLSGTSELSVNTEFLDKEIHESKREGFIELSGLLIGAIGANRITLWGGKKVGSDILTIKTESFLVVIDEGSGEVKKSDINSNWEWKTEFHKIIYYQSELTQSAAKDILLKGKCDLTSLQESFDLHKPFLQQITRFYNQVSISNIDYCPIT